MPLLLTRLTGLSLLFMPTSFVVRVVGHCLQAQSRFGSIADRLSFPKIAAADGKNFTSVPAVQPGGVGAAIALLQP
jgi:hypothetical protein